MLYHKDDGQEPKSLPPYDRDAEGNLFSDLENSQDARDATGWVEEPATPEHDPLTHRRVWDGPNRAWIIEPIPSPPVIVPAMVSRMQAKRALLDAGMLATVDAAIAASNDAALKLYYAEASDFHRDHPALIEMTSALGMTSEQVDDLFIAAAAIV